MSRISSLAAVLLACAACGNDHGLIGDPPGGGGTSAGLPCDVEEVIGAQCQGCHGSPLAGNAPIRLVTYEDLARKKGGLTIAELSVMRMRDTVKPMPPAPSTPVSTADTGVLESWIAAGMPKGDCGGGEPGPFDVPATCTTGHTWTGGNHESPLMHPGAACITCHKASGEGPRYTVAGTVYATGHEPTDCNGATGSIFVEITDAANLKTQLPVNSVGNFFSRAAFKFPIRAKVIANGKERVMVGPQASGDCNTCHSQTGNTMAPGRIALP
ncbi:MAG: uncharacterized protein H6Q90_4898 [Deltaproteobacteria bacterium]|nr:uncharacterized protein [Deltaproteobacteria bacterium]